MTTHSDVEQFISALTQRLADRFPAYRVGAYEPTDSEIAPHQIWVTDDSMGIPEEIADEGMSTEVVLPVYATLILDPPTSNEMAVVARQRRMELIAVCQGVIREFSDRLMVIMRPEELVPRQNYIGAYLQMDIRLFSLESD